MLPPNTLLRDRYRVVAVLDERPGNWLYRAEDTQASGTVLIAALAAPTDEAREDLSLLAGQIAALRNDVILPLTEHFAEGDTYYLVSADPGGQDLERLLRIRGPQPETTVLPQVTWLLTALEYLHGQRPPLFLGDPLPSDIWVLEDGSWRLVPFVLARPIGNLPSPYRAPELAEPDADMTPVSDTYAVGALLYQVLTGMPPTTAQQQKAGAPLIGPRSLNPAISLLCEQLLLRALQLRPVNRYQAANEMRTALETVHMMAGRSLGLGPDVMNNTSQPPASPSTQPLPAPAQPVQPAPPAQPAQSPQPAPTIYVAQAPEVSETPSAAPQVTLPPSTPSSAEVPTQGIYTATAAPPKKSGLSTGCLVSMVVALVLLVLTICVLAALIFFPGGPLNWLINSTSPSSVPTAPAASGPLTSLPAAPAPQLGARAITLQNSSQLTETATIAGEINGSVAYSPDGKLLAIGMGNKVRVVDSSDFTLQRDLAIDAQRLNALAWSPDSRMLAVSSTSDAQVYVWDVSTGNLVRTLRGHDSWVRSVDWSRDGRWIATGSTDLTVRVWDAETGQTVHILEGHTDLVGGVQFSPDSKLLASGSRDGTVRLWDSEGQQVSSFRFETPMAEPSINLRHWVTGVAWSPDGKQIAVGTTDGAARILDSATGRVLHELPGHQGFIVIQGVKYSPDGNLLATASIDSEIRLWNPATGEAIGELKGHRFQVFAITISADNKRLLSASDEEGRLVLWDLEKREEIGSQNVGQGAILSLVFTPDSKVVASSGLNGNVRLHSVDNSATTIPSLDGSAFASQQSIAFVDDLTLVAITQRNRVSIFKNDGEAGRPLSGLEGIPLAVTTSPNQALIAAGDDEGNVVVWNASNGDIQAKLKSELPAVSYLSFNDDGSLLAVAGSSADPRIEVWDTMAQQKIQTLIGSQGAIPAMSFQPRGDLVAASDARGVLRLWNARDGQLVHTMSATEEQTSFVSLAFTPDGNALATGAINGDIQFWDPKTGEQATLLRTGYDRVFALAFSPNGEILAVGSRDTTVRLLRLPSN